MPGTGSSTDQTAAVTDAAPVATDALCRRLRPAHMCRTAWVRLFFVAEGGNSSRRVAAFSNELIKDPFISAVTANIT